MPQEPASRGRLHLIKMVHWRSYLSRPARVRVYVCVCVWMCGCAPCSCVLCQGAVVTAPRAAAAPPCCRSAPAAVVPAVRGAFWWTPPFTFFAPQNGLR